MKLDRYIELTGDRVPAWKTAICRYLESLGYKFLVDFGYENARDLAMFARKRARE